MRPTSWLEFLSDYDCEISLSPGESKIGLADTLSQQILEAQIEAMKPENIEAEDVECIFRDKPPKGKV
ncbi:hypothetical protein Tco_0072141 [Tanacetum coccineum]